VKTLPPGMQAHLDSGATTLCWCWRIARGDGLVQGFTDHDRSVVFGGVSYEAAAGISASEVQSALGLAVDNVSVAGALSSQGLAEKDLLAGLYDGADIEIWRVNWNSADQRVLMRKGTLGEFKRGALGFEVEVRGLAQQLNQPMGRVFGHSCDADLGDDRCTVDLTSPAYRGNGAVTAAADARRFQASGLGAFANGWFSGGRLTFTSGANTGRAMDVKRHYSTSGVVSIELWQPMSEPLAAGDAFSITAGCDKQFGTCKAKFANQLNFRGFPYMPGNDAVLSYPSRGDTLDGKSHYGN
jgi:uncharacterized phage protein (TIGR02218 family)